MKALNKAFEKAFSNSERENSISDLLACMGEEMGCIRISIFEENEKGICNNTYEWCCPGTVREQLRLQGVPAARFDTWKDRLLGQKIIVVTDPGELKDSDPDVYQMFLAQGINSALVTLLAFQGMILGFCILEDPSREVMEDRELIMPGIRYILSSMIYSHNLVSRLRKLGYTDTLTGVGNRISLYEYLESLDRTLSVSVICVDVIGWDDARDKLLHLEREQTLLRAGEILGDLFDDRHVFRIATGEFVIVENGASRASFENYIRMIRGLFRDHNLLTAVSGEWKEQLPGSIDSLIHMVLKETEKEKRILVSHRSAKLLQQEEEENSKEEKAEIPLPRGDDFFRMADQFLAGVFDAATVTIVTDINYFKLYNDIFGRKAGNIFLENLALSLQKVAREQHGVCGYIGGDNFCLIFPSVEKDVDGILRKIGSFYHMLDYPDGFCPAMGVYYSDDPREPMITLYDRAMTALSEIKGDYMTHIHLYNALSHQNQMEDKLLLMRVREGLEKNEFTFYVQPQVHERSGKIIGGEALVRWLHGGELIPPGRFIPILEKSGYVYAVDSYVWEAVARWQRRLLDLGIRPVPLSVNVSRVDFYFDDIAKHFIDLIRKYDLDPELVGVEITESAFTDNTDTILDAIRKLHEAGFHILMDDFGSGSSSLSMLHTLNLDVLKTDVQFMSKDEQDNRAISIVEFVISMAHMIGMSVVTEGVETEAQKDNLIALGDNYAQGFYFYKPMPKERFEELISNPSNVGEGYKKTDLYSASQLRFKDMIREGLVSEPLLNNIIRAAAIFKEQNEELFIVQVNTLFTEATGVFLNDDRPQSLPGYLDPGELIKLRQMMQQANHHPLGGSEGELCFCRHDGSRISLRIRIFLLYSLEDHRLYLSTMG